MAKDTGAAQVNVGLMGLGMWGREAYVPILKEMDGVRVTAVAARSGATREFAREQIGGGVKLYEDFRDLARDEQVQAVMIVLPNEHHAEAISAAVAAGKHVFFEPPIGLTVEEISEGLAALSGAGGVVQVDHELRYLPVMEAVCGHVRSGAIGEVLTAKVRLWCNWGYGPTRPFDYAEDQGFFLWLGCWYLDVLDCVFGAAPLRAGVAGGYAMNGRLMDHGWATLEYPEGRIGEFEFSLVAVEGTEISVQVLGTRGEVRADIQSGAWQWRDEGKVWREEAARHSKPAYGFAGVRESIADFIGAIRDGRAVKANVEVCRRMHQAALACGRSERERGCVEIEDL